MSQYVRERYAVGNEIRHSLDWKASYEDQAADLANRFRSDASTYRGPYVLVGHSNGGLVNRYMAQQLQDPSLVRGVITVSSPHAGAYLANTTQRVLMGILAVPISGYYMGCDMADAYVCTRGGNLATQVALALAPVLASSAFPVLQEMGTNAPFHGTINQRGDVGYIAAGVQNRIWDRWTMWRVLSDFQRCPDGYFDCDQYSRNYVNAVDKNYHHFIDCAVISGFLGIFWPPSRSTAAGCAKNAAFLRVTDVAYKRLSVGSGHGDGVVPEFSQMYPGAPATMQFLVDDTDSHLGETRSRISAGGVLRALNQGLRIPFDQ
jgi:pimeloyl-ACP methyl ester carboxylesterase